MPTETKTTNTQTTSIPPAASHNPFVGFDPMTVWTQGQAAFHQMMADAFGRMTSFAEQYASMESQFVTRAQGAVSNWAQLTTDAITYGAQLSAQARKAGLENAQKLTSVA